MKVATSLVAFAALLSAATTSAAPAAAIETRSSSGGPVVDLGQYGKWLGTVQNNGTVHSWKGVSRAVRSLHLIKK